MKTCKSLFSFVTVRSGFTLIEIMIVLAILGAVIALGLPRLRRNEENVRTVSRHILVLAKQVHDFARMKNMTYRLAVQMDKDKGYGYWVESSNAVVLPDPNDKDKDKKDDEKTPSLFSENKDVLKAPKKLPSSLIFSSVENQGMEPVSEGVAYIYFFPDGLVQESIIHITDKKNLNWSLIFHPLTGRVDVNSENVSLKDLDK